MTDQAPERLVARVFDLLLGRPPTEAEKNNFVDTLNGAAGALALLESIAGCSEYKERRFGQQKLRSHDLVGLLFKGFLARLPTETEAEHFSRLQENGARTEDLILRLFESDEFQARQA